MIKHLTNKLKSLALLDAIVEPEWQYRYFSYDSTWSNSEEMGSLRDGSGGQWFLWTSGSLAGYKCVSPEDGLIDNLEEVKLQFPQTYKPFITEPAFTMDHATAIWYLDNSEWVKHGKKVDYLIDLNSVSSWGPKDYVSWANEYYEREINLVAVQNIFAQEFSEKDAKLLNKEIDLISLEKEIIEIGFNS